MMRCDLPLTREDALARLDDFVPHAAGHYAKKRNFDFGRGNHHEVSRLSAALRRRLITEEEVIKEVLKSHPFKAAEKYIQEVFWRTYWKGWLEMRPSLWADYTAVTAAPQRDSKTLNAALAGQTGIACFDEWLAELKETNYLHNHARMWFASIWIHTFNLPWQAGAHLFMTHLADGDPASNTLGWRWVAGLQTRGKAYIARADNIDEFTRGRYQPYGDLNELARAVEGPENPPASLPRLPYQAPDCQRPLWLITGEDCYAKVTAPMKQAAAIAVLPAECGGAFRSKAVLEIEQQAQNEAAQVLAQQLSLPLHHIPYGPQWQDDVMALAREVGADSLALSYQPVGYWNDSLNHLRHAAPLPFAEYQYGYDALCWPHAKKGFFPFKEKIPSFIRDLGL